MGEKLTINGFPLNSAGAIAAVIEDMKKTVAAPDMTLDMMSYAGLRGYGQECHACAGGSAVIHSLGASKRSGLWTESERAVAEYYSAVMFGSFDDEEVRAYPVPKSVQSAHRDDMTRSDDPELCFKAWERFHAAWVRYEEREARRVDDVARAESFSKTVGA